jgi:chromosome segregation ATPase
MTVHDEINELGKKREDQQNALNKAVSDIAQNIEGIKQTMAAASAEIDKLKKELETESEKLAQPLAPDKLEEARNKISQNIQSIKDLAGQIRQNSEQLDKIQQRAFEQVALSSSGLAQLQQEFNSLNEKVMQELAARAGPAWDAYRTAIKAAGEKSGRALVELADLDFQMEFKDQRNLFHEAINALKGKHVSYKKAGSELFGEISDIPHGMAAGYIPLTSGMEDITSMTGNVSDLKVNP